MVADSEDSMIEFSTATSGDDTLAVELEDILISFNSNGDGSVDQSSLQRVSGVGSDELVSTSNLNSLVLVVLAVTIFSSVGIVRFEFKTILGSIFNSEVRPATVATFILISVAINDLLFREGEELAVVDEVETFEDTGDGESPA